MTAKQKIAELKRIKVCDITNDCLNKSVVNSMDDKQKTILNNLIFVFARIFCK